MGEMDEVRHERFLRLLSRAQPFLRRFVLAHIPDFHQAEDALQEITVVLWKKYGEFRGDSSFESWAFGVARNQVLRSRRDSARSRLVLSGDASRLLEDRLLEMGPELDMRARHLERCLDELPERARKLIDMKYGRGEATDRIAQALGKTGNAIQVMLFRLRKAIWRCIERALREGVGETT